MSRLFAWILVTLAAVLFAGLVYVWVGGTTPLKSVKMLTPPPSASLNIPYEQQLADNWCWAACAVMAVKALGYTADQCDTARRPLGRPPGSCCTTTGSVVTVVTACDETGWPPFDELGFHSLHTTSTALTLAVLKSEIGIHHRPVAFAWEWTDSVGARTGSGHIMIAGGYSYDAPDDMIEVYNPLCPEYSNPAVPGHPCGWKQISYAEYVSGMLDNQTEYLHWDDYYEIVHQ